MYRCIVVVSLLLLTLAACGKDQPTKVKNGALLSEAIATQPLVEPPTTQHKTQAAAIPAATVTQETTADSTASNQEAPVAVEPSTDNTQQNCTAATQADIDEPTTAIVTIGLQNRFGEVLLPHRLHVARYHCYVCHTTNPPGKISKTKKEFHALCRKCHAQLKQGPTKCRGCHTR